ncbi:hypothetical protein, partial [Escherichia coli]|uniref:hypothetical protein n=1 Tax=Escherichia coli TaxID=562 RepID=UPI001A7F110C
GNGFCQSALFGFGQSMAFHGGLRVFLWCHNSLTVGSLLMLISLLSCLLPLSLRMIGCFS